MENKFEITAADLRPLEDFPLKWRWTDTRHQLLAPEILEQINPLSERKVAELTNFHKHFLSFLTAAAGETINAETEEIESVERWLRHRIGNENFVFVSWSEEWAVRTTAEIFCRHWNTFCYPASDDVSVSAEIAGWILFYHHDEVFSFETTAI